MLLNIINRSATYALIVSRLTYSINYFNISSIFVLVAKEINESIYGLGLISTSFLIGISVFQIPGGLLSSRIGPRKTIVCGSAIYSLAALLSAASIDITSLAILRFFVGLGMSLATSPGISLVVKYFRRGSEGLGVGLHNAAASLGGAMGIFGWLIVAELVGWRQSLLIGGILGLAMTIILQHSVPSDHPHPGDRIDLKILGEILKDMRLLQVGLAALGAGVGQGIIATFMVYYVENYFGESPQVAGLIASLLLVSSIIASTFAGRLYDSLGNPRVILFIAMFLLTVGVATPALGTIYSAILATILVGVGSSMTYTIVFATAQNLRGENAANIGTLSVGWMNSISYAGFWSPVVFSLIAGDLGYASAWIIMAASFTWIIPLTISRNSLRLSPSVIRP